MLARESVLRRLPAGLDPKQTLFLDGIRHAAEISDLAHRRLQFTLTHIATANLKEGEAIEPITAAFLDAWAIVDSIDRFRTLWALLPVTGKTEPPSEESGVGEVFQSIRNLRNVGDHLAQRADYVVANQGTALGVLSWFTVTDNDKVQGLSCAIVPGTQASRSTPLINPIGKNIDLPTGFICLAAGEHTACLSAALTAMAHRISHLESKLEVAFNKLGIADRVAGADVLIMASMEAVDPSIAIKHAAPDA